MRRLKACKRAVPRVGLPWRVAVACPRKALKHVLMRALTREDLRPFNTYYQPWQLAAMQQLAAMTDAEIYDVIRGHLVR